MYVGHAMPRQCHANAMLQSKNRFLWFRFFPFGAQVHDKTTAKLMMMMMMMMTTMQRVRRRAIGRLASRALPSYAGRRRGRASLTLFDHVALLLLLLNPSCTYE